MFKMSQRRKEELAKRLKELGFTFEKYRDCVVLEFAGVSYWVTPHPVKFVVTSNEDQRSFEFYHVRNVVSFLNTLKEMNNDL
ncbi:hypothetical protein OPFAMLBM_00337 [Aeromonas phage avDM12-TAAL]|nr:hypothetical protein OPFAMLBM_00337 [Aeromonas phage avDM12-TAAL]